MEKYLFKNISDEYGEQFIYKFDNGYGASVIRNTYSHGGNVGLWEMACICFYDDESEYEISYSSEFGGVRGFLNWEEVEKVLEGIKSIK